MAHTRHCLAASLLLASSLSPALAKATGPSLYNPQTVAISTIIEFDDGNEFRSVINARELKVLKQDAQIKSMQVFLSNGHVLQVVEGDAPKMRHKLDKAQDQVWVVDGNRICVLDSHKFKRKAGFMCPAH